jgi:hypothetical protein
VSEFCQEKGAMQIRSQGSRDGLIVKQRDCLDGNKRVKMSGCLFAATFLKRTDTYTQNVSANRERVVIMQSYGVFHRGTWLLLRPLSCRINIPSIKYTHYQTPNKGFSPNVTNNVTKEGLELCSQKALSTFTATKLRTMKAYKNRL